jgi:hypothetical protein
MRRRSPRSSSTGRGGVARAKLLIALKICALKPNIIHKALVFGIRWGLPALLTINFILLLRLTVFLRLGGNFFTV